MISIRGASEHNLKSIDLDIPRGALTVVTGVSGSGKSSLAFDTVCAEGRRRYLETFSSYARQFLGAIARPSVASIEGLSPAIALDQQVNLSSPRSTVGTMAEIYDLFRLLWARVGERLPGTPAASLERALFSFNSPHGACPRCKGLGVEDRIDPDLLVADPARSVRDGALRITTPSGYVIYSQVTLAVLDEVCRAHGFSVDVPWQSLTAEQRDVILNGSDRLRIPYGKHPLASRLRWRGIVARPREEGVYKGILPVMEHILRSKRNRNILRFVRSMPCQACRGTRLRPEALSVTVRGLTIAQAAALSIDEAGAFFTHSNDLSEEQTEAREGVRPEYESEAEAAYRAIAAQIVARCRVLQALGLGYLTLDRESTTLSSGESRRVRLARLAGIGLGGVLYVLDEPSAGLHHRDTTRLLDVLHGIVGRGNTVLVVEHDEQTARRADWLVDVGPGAGRAGGHVLYSGPAAAFVALEQSAAWPRLPESRTHAFLTGRDGIPVPDARRGGSGPLHLSGMTRHNLSNVTVEFRLGAHNVVTGVSGAGKSTLVEETVRALRAKPPHARDVDKIIAIDQAPIGRTPRSNPATYTGIFDHVRDLFARQPVAVARAFDKGRFSFNVKGGRCEACEGAGVLQVGMQFLGTASVVCDVCAGRRFNEDTLEVRYRDNDIHDVLEMSIEQAAAFFAEQPPIARGLAAMRSLGLGYLALGHPATMLSGGEAQRVKLAAELSRPGTGRTLYVLDEPTAGLHPADVRLLLSAIDGLLAKGNTVVTVEHDLDVIKTADWIVDMGPGSGAAGGRVVVMGTPEEVGACGVSVTGEVLREHLSSTPGARSGASAARLETADRFETGDPRREPRPIRLVNVCTHNLWHVDVEIPANRLTVITGVSGSGKSSLAFDTLFAESQRRFTDSFSTYARRFLSRSSEAEFDEATGLTPAIAISQRLPSRNPRSTVATLTEIHDTCRLLFARAGVRRCPRCSATLEGSRCPRCPFSGSQTLTASMFSPNSEHGACPRCKGLGFVLDCDPAKLVTDPSRALMAGAMAGHKTGRFYGDPSGQHMAILSAAGRALGLDFSVPWRELGDPAREIALRGAGDRTFDVEWAYVRGKRKGVHRFQARWPGLLACVREEYERKHADKRGEAMDALMAPSRCDACGGEKLNAEARSVRVAGLGIHDLLAKSVEESLAWFERLDADPRSLPARLRATADVRADVVRRLRRLRDAGLSYLTLDRSAASLSGGEAQRVRLATQLGAGLTGITYVLDEPTVGLHPRDTARLIGLLRELRDTGNTVVVVEHERDVVAAADYVLELGPGPGREGGCVVARGTPDELRGMPASRTAGLLAGSPAPHVPAARPPLVPGLAIRAAAMHNLKDVDVDVPGGFVCVTGVSGSGKSTLVFGVLAPSAERGEPVNCRGFLVRTPYSSVVRVGHAPVFSSPRSNPATHTGVFDDIRDLFARTGAAAAAGLGKRHFSTSTPGGRCEACEGLGEVRVSMDFLPDVWVTCEECGGSRYRADVLRCAIDGRSVADVLDMTVEEAFGFFGSERLAASVADRRETRRSLQNVASVLDMLRDVGLGYIRLGQPVRTLSGGERQRLLLANGLLQPSEGARLYLFDEPTSGLHRDDVARLLRMFARLAGAGHMLVAIEHNLDVIAHADWVIDLGPEGGPGGGRVVASGPPEAIAAAPESHTGRALRST